jgi:hypothetical protein
MVGYESRLHLICDVRLGLPESTHEGSIGTRTDLWSSSEHFAKSNRDTNRNTKRIGRGPSKLRGEHPESMDQGLEYPISIFQANRLLEATGWLGTAAVASCMAQNRPSVWSAHRASGESEILRLLPSICILGAARVPTQDRRRTVGSVMLFVIMERFSVVNVTCFRVE